MPLKKDIHKSRHFFHKKLINLMSFLFRRYLKLPKVPPRNPYSSSKNNPRKNELNDLYRDVSEKWESDHNEAMEMKKSTKTMKEAMREDNAASESITDYTSQSVLKREKEKEKVDMCGRGGHVLAQKMKELEMMMNVNDVDHVMDIEEALYLYSRLTCPVYVDLLEKFFMDMYSEFILPKPSLSVNNSMRRLGPVKL
ncbi:hypothetical protein LguiA_028661 [Lonicera macranthoides]